MQSLHFLPVNKVCQLVNATLFKWGVLNYFGAAVDFVIFEPENPKWGFLTI